MKKIILIILGIMVASGAFYGGMQYAQAKARKQALGMRAGFINLSPEDRQNRMQMAGGPEGSARGAVRINGANGGMASGEILSRDDKSITVKLGDGGSKIIFISGSTKVIKTVEASIEELSAGEEVVVMGSANSDGSVSALTVQIKPEMANSQK